MFNYYFLVADTDLCLSVAKLQVTRVPEVFWSQSYESFGVSWLQIVILTCPIQSSQVTRVPEVFWSQIPISACLLQSSQVTRVPEVF